MPSTHRPTQRPPLGAAARLTLALTLAVLLPLQSAATQQRTAAAEYDAAYIEWDRGNYHTALDGMLRLLARPDGAPYLERIAELTGEVFHTWELTTDGRAPRFSHNGRIATYETGSPAVTRIVDLSAAPRVIAEIPATGVALSPAGDRIAYLRVTDDAELRTARAAVNAAAVPERPRAQAQLAYLEGKKGRVIVRDLRTQRETAIADNGLLKGAMNFSADGTTLYVLTAEERTPDRSQIHALRTGANNLVPVTTGEGFKLNPEGLRGNRYMLYSTANQSPVRFAPATTPAPPGGGRGGGAGGGPGAQAATFVLDTQSGQSRRIPGTAVSTSSDGSTLVYLAGTPAERQIVVEPVAGGTPVTVKQGGQLAAPALSANGRRVAFQIMEREDWEIHLVDADGRNETRLTREIQHDLMPHFLDDNRIFALKGEARHRRSYMYDATTAHPTRLFHNNLVRTIAPEYQWIPSGDGSRVLIVADRDGNTISAERGVYVMDLTRKVTSAELTQRLRTELAAEQDLRARGEAMFAPIAAEVRAVVADASITRVYDYQRDLFEFDSKHISQPGNAKAIEYLHNKFRSFGYEPELQWFDRANALGGRTANVLATLRGTVNPELVYIVSSHFDSVERGPGADDNSSGTAALLEAARILADKPQAATIIFAAFTGEEAGLLGSREWVRQAVANDIQLVGALNNDMIGWTRNHRLDNTIRYSNPGIRDIQHAAAFLFTDLITYDALYYRSTDAAAYYEHYGDIVGGIGSYPVLGNPHYHQVHDVLETINHQLVTEVGKTTAASLMMLASSPSRLGGLQLARTGSDVRATWTAARESGVVSYTVAWGPESDPLRNTTSVTGPAAILRGVEPGMVVSVKAVNAKGLSGWDWARAVAPAR
jgi:hypothetical protein